MKKILYLTWGENIVGYGIFNSQVKQQIVQLARHDSCHITLLTGYPTGLKFLKSPARYREELNKIRDELGCHDVDFYTRRINALSSWLNSRFYQLPLYLYPHLHFFKKFVQEKGFEIIHCRSYHAARLACQVRERYGLNYKVVFDTRGLIPEEGVVIGRYSKDSRSYRTWKRIEKYLVENSDAIVNVSETFTEHIRTICSAKAREMITIYTSVDTNVFIQNHEERSAMRDHLGIDTREKVMVYAGSLSENGWHRPTALAKVYMAFRRFFNTSRLLIITNADRESLMMQLKDAGVDLQELMIVQAKSPQQVNAFLLAGDYGVLSYKPVDDDIEKLVSHTVLAIKTAEYLACGLPLIVNKETGGASALVDKYSVGCTFDLNNLSSLNVDLKNIEENYTTISKVCRDVAEDLFSTKKNAERYLQIYNRLVN